MAWYYNLNNQQTGPVDEAGVKDLIAAGQITHNTLVWQSGMERWQPASATPLAAMLPEGPPPLVGPPPMDAAAPTPQATPAARVKQIKLYFMLWWILMADGFLLCFSIRVFGPMLGIPALIASAVFGCLLLHRLWSAVQDGRAETTAGKAVGFLCIPFFNFYWQFVAIWGLAKDLNRYAREHSITAPQANEKLALIGCILSCCAVVPCLGLLALFPAGVISVLAMKGMCDTARAIIEGPAR